jgi:2-iminobutanoate/2-iminopropanoate deaminase
MATLQRTNPAAIHAPAPTYCQIAEDTTRGIIHIAGQVGLSADGALAGADMASQLRQLLRNFDAILGELGLDRGAFIKRTVFVTDMDEYLTPAVDAQLRAYFGEKPCPSTLVGVTRLFRRDVKIEIDAVLHR